MDRKKILKSIPRFAAWAALLTCSLIIKLLPERLLYGFARNLAAFAFLVLGKQRRTALESLQTAFGNEKNAQERRKIALDCFIFMAKSAVELLFFLDRPQRIRERVRLSGKQYLDAALAQNRGVILVSAHFGNFPLLLAKLSLEGFKAGAIMRPMRDVRTEKFFVEKRRRFGVKTIYSQPRQACVEETIRALRNNELILIPIDQNFGTAGVFVDFFGRKAATATGPVVLAQRTKAVLLPCFIIRQDDDTHRVVFEPAIDLGKAADHKGLVLDTTQKLTVIIESYIRKYPAEWGWIHRRWKSKPNLKEGGVQNGG